MKEKRVRKDERNFRVAINVSVFNWKGYLRMHNYLSRSESPSQTQTLGIVFGTCKAFPESFRPRAIELHELHIQTGTLKGQVSLPKAVKDLKSNQEP